ncbi:chemokine-like protein TAFA-5 [Lampris incognitus]|uniref:chemokine-like protein TAFA-5 n=1 Tax=Lampris incognitus TaxID=2546036 RepID=UPI0024B623EF|nr:chemokine-like protein TAFA-5 [Lampris incognitus]
MIPSNITKVGAEAGHRIDFISAKVKRKSLNRLLDGQLAAGTCEIVTLDRDSSQPRRTIARQTARCACKKGQIAGTTRARPACVDAGIVRSRQWCKMLPCLEDEGCDLLVNQSGWTCTQPGGRIKTTTRLLFEDPRRSAVSVTLDSPRLAPKSFEVKVA